MNSTDFTVLISFAEFNLSTFFNKTLFCSTSKRHVLLAISSIISTNLLTISKTKLLQSKLFQ